jgi:hypothetical protein
MIQVWKIFSKKERCEETEKVCIIEEFTSWKRKEERQVKILKEPK